MSSTFFAGFQNRVIPTAPGVEINAWIGGQGPPLLLLHGHPETHVAWWKVAPRLAERFTVVVSDLRGYGDSSKPNDGYSKREMGADQVKVMSELGFGAFQAVGHDRGGRVLRRMMLDHPAAVQRGVVLDIAPTELMYAATNEEFATKYFWWFFHIQPAPLPEDMIGASTELYLRAHLDEQSKTAGAVSDDAFAEYLRCYREPGCIHAVCEDYRASVAIDREHSKADDAAGRKVEQPLLALWGEKGTVGKMFDVIGLWKKKAVDVTGCGLPCGHLIPEEDPDGLLAALDDFLTS